jgi:hypothetical protein
MPSTNPIGLASATAKARAATTRAIAGLELPDCFAAATVAAEARLLAVAPSDRTVAQKRDLRRIASQAARLERGGL